MTDTASPTACIGCRRPVADSRCTFCGVARAPGGLKIISVLSETQDGRVYRGEDATGRAVAVKELLFAVAADATRIERFQREAALLRQLQHPQIPRFLGSFSEGVGSRLRLYLVQEFVEGESLLARAADHPLPESEVLEIAREVLCVLEYLHGLSPALVHRDIKPANLIASPDGPVRLIDFGIARDLRGGVTHGATFSGTAAYMPPEQFGGTLDATADLYALGATLVYLLTGHEPPPLAPPPTFLPARMRFFLSGLMASDRAERFGSAREAREALAALDGVVLHETARPRRLGWIAVVAALVLAGVGSRLFARRHAPAPAAAQATRPPELRQPHPPIATRTLPVGIALDLRAAAGAASCLRDARLVVEQASISNEAVRAASVAGGFENRPALQVEVGFTSDDATMPCVLRVATDTFGGPALELASSKGRSAHGWLPATLSGERARVGFVVGDAGVGAVDLDLATGSAVAVQGSVRCRGEGTPPKSAAAYELAAWIGDRDLPNARVAAFSPDGRRIALGLQDEVEIWEVGGSRVATVPGAAAGLTWVTDSQLAVADRNRVLIWDVAQRAVVSGFETSTLVALSTRGGALIAIDSLGSVFRDGELRFRGARPVQRAAAGHDGTVTIDDTGRIEVRDEDGALVRTAQSALRNIFQLRLGEDDSVAVAASEGYEKFAATGQRVASWRFATDETGRLVLAASGSIQYGLRLSPDGTVGITPLPDGRLVTWDLAAGGAPLGVVVSGATGVAALSPDGRFAYQGGKLLDLTRDAALPSRRHAAVSSVAAHPQKPYVAALHDDGLLELWDAETGVRRWQAQGTGPVQFEGDFLAAGEARFDPSSGRVQGGANHPVSGERALVLSNGDVEVRGGDRHIAVLRGQCPIETAALSADGKQVVTAHGALGVWDADTGHLLDETPLPMTAKVRSVAFGANGSLVAGMQDGTVQVWRRTRTVDGPAAIAAEGVLAIDWVRSIGTAPVDEIVLEGDGRTALIRTSGRREVRELAHGDAVGTISPQADQDNLRGGFGFSLSVGKQGRLELIDARSGQIRFRVPGDSAFLNSAGTLGLSLLAEGGALVWNARTGRQLAHVRTQRRPGVRSGALGASGRVAVTAAVNSVDLWDFTARSAPRTLMAVPGDVRFEIADVALSPREDLAAICDRSGKVRLFELPSGTEVALPGQHGCRPLAFSPDNKRLAAGNAVIDVRQHSTHPTRGTLAADLRTAAWVDDDGTVVYGEIESPRILGLLRWPRGLDPAAPWHIALAVGKDVLLVGTSDGMLLRATISRKARQSDSAK